MALKVIILRAAGTNCDLETEHGFRLAGAAPERVHVRRLLDGDVRLADYGMLVIPGGFSYGDDLSAGKVLANELRFRLRDQFFGFACRGRPVIGICNGFQVLVKTGLLPFSRAAGRLEATLAVNDSGFFETRWIRLRAGGRTPLLDGVRGEILALPVAHGEGKFLVRTGTARRRIEAAGQVAFTYAAADGGPAAYPDNPNGSPGGIAAVANEAGNILGMMPHPERFLFAWCHPAWTRGAGRSVDGLRILRSFVNAYR